MLLSDSASHYCASVFCCIHGYPPNPPQTQTHTFIPTPSLCLQKWETWGLLTKPASIPDILLLVNLHQGAGLWPTATPSSLFFFVLQSGCAHVGLERTLALPSTLTIVEIAQSSKHLHQNLDRGGHFLNTFKTPSGCSQKRCNLWKCEKYSGCRIQSSFSPTLLKKTCHNSRHQCCKDVWHVMSG